jgi:hypothetical protein
MVKLNPISPETLTYIDGIALGNEIRTYLDKRTEGMYPEDRDTFVGSFDEIIGCILGDVHSNNSISCLSMDDTTFDRMFYALQWVDADHNPVSIGKNFQNQGIFVRFLTDSYCYETNDFINKHFYIPVESIYDLYEDLKALYPKTTTTYWRW